ncbi:MAG: hypothetical protein PHF64_00390 [Methanoregula sp.]|nr:hypothetical protein [Methanoregula sp.]
MKGKRTVDMEGRPLGKKPDRPYDKPTKCPTVKHQIGVELLDMAKDRNVSAETRLGAIKVLRGMFPSDF